MFNAKWITAAALGFALTIPAVASADGGYGNHHHKSKKKKMREIVSVVDHHAFGTDIVVNGATALIRDLVNKQINATITSNALEPDTAYSIWWAIFNRPQFCATPYDCQVSDLERFGGDPQVHASVFWGGGFISDAFGTANTAIRLVPGRTKRELFAETKPYGLVNFDGAEIHVVLRSHGPAGLAGPIAQQIGTAGAACPPENCSNVFASVHPGRNQ